MRAWKPPGDVSDQSFYDQTAKHTGLTYNIATTLLGNTVTQIITPLGQYYMDPANQVQFIFILCFSSWQPPGMFVPASRR